jgi:hypothetical protein
MKLLICGSRSVTDPDIIFSSIEKSLSQLVISKKQIKEVIHGGAKGVDRIAGDWAKKNNIPVKIFYPDWDLGKKAGPLRNIEMCEYVGKGNPLICIHDGVSKGALQCYVYGREIGLKAYICLAEAKNES